MAPCVQNRAGVLWAHVFLCHPDGLLVGNEATLRGALVTVETLVGGVQALVADSAARCREKVERHEALTREQREVLLQLLVSRALGFWWFWWF